MTTLYVRDHNAYREAAPEEILKRAYALLAQRFRAGSPALTTPSLTREFLRLRVAHLDHEVFGAIFLDTRHRVITVETLFQGTLDRASVHPREVVKSALAHNAASLILFHNHVSLVSEPSQADELITRRLKEALSLVDIRVLDHLIIAEPIFSFSESGLL
jgi:DNA repair protein RadC